MLEVWRQDWVLTWLRAFGITVALEVGVVWLLQRRRAGHVRCVSAGLLAQLLTHPSVWFALPHLALPHAAYLGLAECFAWLAEAALYRLCFARTGVARALGVSACANGASWAVGALLRAYGWAF